MSERYFLLTYDRVTRTTDVQEFPIDRATDAMEAYDKLERQYDGDETKQVVLLGAESIETLHKTHPNYFGIKPSRNDLLVGI